MQAITLRRKFAQPGHPASLPKIFPQIKFLTFLAEIVFFSIAHYGQCYDHNFVRKIGAFL
jgi:hypothetical protein